LALAIQVSREQARDKDDVPQISDEEAKLVLFFVSGVAFLTTCFNATTAPALVSWLGITEAAETQLKIMKKFNEQMVSISIRDDHPAAVTAALQRILKHVEDHFHHTVRTSKKQLPQVAGERRNITMSNEKILQEYEAAETKWKQVEFKHRAKAENLVANTANLATQISSGHWRDETCYSQAHAHHYVHGKSMLINVEGSDGRNIMLQCKETVGREVDKENEDKSNFEHDVEMSIVINHALLTMAHKAYHKLIETSDLRPGSFEANLLSSSVHVAMSADSGDLQDYNHIHKQERQNLRNKNGGRSSAVFASMTQKFDENGIRTTAATSATAATQRDDRDSRFSKFVDSTCFNGLVTFAILIYVIFVGIEHVHREDQSTGDFYWLGIELTFCVIFLVEFALKFAHMKKRYFVDPWNAFDIFVVVLGWGGALWELWHYNTDGKASNESKFTRMTRVLRAGRFLRMFRNLHDTMNRGSDVSPDLDVQMTRLSTYQCYAAVQIHGQIELLEYYSGDGNVGTRDVFLPIELDGNQILRKEEGADSFWKAINPSAESYNSPGIIPRKTKNLKDEMLERHVPWGEVVEGVDEGDGWVRCQVQDESEAAVARCILQSQTNVYKAWCEVINVQLQLELTEGCGSALLEGLQQLQYKKQITERLEQYVEQAETDGAISGKQAQAILHPLHKQISDCLRQISKTKDGRLLENLVRYGDSVLQQQTMTRKLLTQHENGSNSKGDPESKKLLLEHYKEQNGVQSPKSLANNTDPAKTGSPRGKARKDDSGMSNSSKKKVKLKDKPENEKGSTPDSVAVGKSH